MKTVTYNYLGVIQSVIRVNFYCLPDGFVVRRHSRGYVTGHLTGRGGWGKPEIAKVFADAQEAADCAHKAGVRSFEVLHNVKRGAL